MDSILLSIKKLLGVSAEYEHFDIDIIMLINSVFMTLNQLGVGPVEGFSIKDATAVWTDFIPEADLIRIEAVKTYIYLNVKLIFDPPTSSAVMESMNRKITEYESRLNMAVETPY